MSDTKTGGFGFGLAHVKVDGTYIRFDQKSVGDDSAVIPTTWFEFSIEDTRIQEVVDHLKKIGIDYDPRRF